MKDSAAEVSLHFQHDETSKAEEVDAIEALNKSTLNKSANEGVFVNNLSISDAISISLAFSVSSIID